MRATVPPRVPVKLLLPLVLFATVTFHVEAADTGADGTVGPGIYVCVDTDVDQNLVNTCLQTSFCVRGGLDQMAQTVCAPID